MAETDEIVESLRAARGRAFAEQVRLFARNSDNLSPGDAHAAQALMRRFVLAET